MKSNQKELSASDLPIVNGRIYHLDLAPGELADKIIIVGDPARVNALSKEFFVKIEVEREHRGLRTATGITKKGHRISLVTSGMGTPSLEIVLNEIVILHEIDFATRKRKTKTPNIQIIRLGTSGALQKETALGTAIITQYAIGLDNTGLFYDVPSPDKTCLRIEEKAKQVLQQHSSKRFATMIFPYASKADEQLVQKMRDIATTLNVPHKKGITVTSSGFFANQGRDISSISPTIKDLDEHISKVVIGDLKAENMEMETSFLLHFMKGTGHRAASICATIAHRKTERFSSDYKKNVYDAARIAIGALEEVE